MTSISTNMYINKLDDIQLINTTMHILEALELNLMMESQAYKLTLKKKTIRKVPNLKLVIM